MIKREKGEFYGSTLPALVIFKNNFFLFVCARVYAKVRFGVFFILSNLFVYSRSLLNLGAH